MKRYYSPVGYMDEDKEGEYIHIEDYNRLREAVERLRMMAEGGPVDRQVFIVPAWAMHDLMNVLDSFNLKGT